MSAVAASLLLSGCEQFTIVGTTPVPTAATIGLPPLGYAHHYGNDPLAARDAVRMERQLFAQAVYWEVELDTTPAQVGFVNLSDLPAVAAARLAVTSVQLTIATENRATVTGLLASTGPSGEQRYAQSLLDYLRAAGYRNFSSATVAIFFTESVEHAKLTWTRSGGPVFEVFDHTLNTPLLAPAPGQTPLPTAPPAPPAGR